MADDEISRTDFPSYADWLLDHGREDNLQSQQDYADQFSGGTWFGDDPHPFDPTPVSSPVDESPIDSPVGTVETPAATQDNVDEATAEALANAESVLGDLQDVIDTTTTTESTAAAVALATPASTAANATTSATAQAQEALDGLDTAVNQALAEETIAAVDAADNVLPAVAAVPPGLTIPTQPGTTIVTTTPAPPGLDQAAWDLQTTTCGEFLNALDAWLAANLSQFQSAPIAVPQATPFGPVAFDYTGEDDAAKQTPPHYNLSTFTIAFTNTPDPAVIGHVAYPAVTFPDWMDATACGGPPAGGKNPQVYQTCKTFDEWMLNVPFNAKDLDLPGLTKLQELYKEYLALCVKAGGDKKGALESSCAQPLYINICNWPATTASTPDDKLPEGDGKTGPLPAEGLPAEPECLNSIKLPSQGLVGGTIESRLTHVIGMTDADGVLRPIPGASGLPFYIRWGIEGLGMAIAATLNWWGLLAASVANASLCKSATYLNAQFSRMVLSLLNLAFFGAFAKTDRAFEQAMDAECPQEFPSPAEATAAYLASTCSKDEWTCWTRIGDVIPEHAEKVLDAQRDRPGTLQCIDLWRRGMIDRDTLDKRLRSLGVLKQDERDEMVALSYFVPTVSDLIPWMVKDVFNPAVVQQFQLDDNFQQSYSQQAKDWARANGISDEIMQAAWRAHWHLPSPTQLAVFWHRFRHDGRHGTPAQFRERIKDALRQADWLPVWIDDYIDAQYKPLTRVDARRAFEIGALTEKELWTVYTHQGYSDEDAQTLVDYNKELLNRKFAGHWAAKAYQAGTLSVSEATRWLMQDGASQAAVDYALSVAATKRDSARRATCIKAARRRFLQGEIDEPQLIAQIQAITKDLVITGDLVEAAKCDLHNRSKQPAVNQICGWLSNGAIDAAKAFERLQRLGYDDEDAAMLLRDCQLRIGLSISKQQARQIKEAVVRKRQLERERLATLKDVRDNRVRMARLQDSKRSTSERRTRTMLQAAAALALHLHTGVDATFPVIDQYYRAALKNTIVLPEDVLAALAAVASRDTSADIADYVHQVDAAIAGLPAAEAAPEAPEATVILAEQWPPLSE